MTKFFFFSHSYTQNWIIGLLTRISEAKSPFQRERMPSLLTNYLAASKMELFF